MMASVCDDVMKCNRASMNMLTKYFSDERFLFLMVGGVNTLFSTGLFVVLILVIGRHVPSAVCLGISWTVSLTLAFFAYRIFVFRVKGRLWLDFIRYAGTSVTALIMNMGLLAVFVDAMHWPAIPVQLVITVVVILYTYFGHKHVSFRRG